MKSFLIYLEENELKLIKKAAKLSRESTSRFIVNRAIESAESTISVKQAELEAKTYRFKNINEMRELYRILDHQWVPTDEE